MMISSLIVDIRAPLGFRMERDCDFYTDSVALCYTQFMAWQPLSETDVGLDRNFWHIILTTGIAGVGDQIALFARIWAALTFGRHGFFVAPTVLAYSLPMVLFMLVGGAVGGRHPLRALILAGLSLAVVTVTLGGILPLTPGVLIAASFVSGVLDSVRSPTGQSLIALAVTPNHLYEANRIRQARFQVTRLLGPVAAGALIAVLGVRHTFLAATLLYVMGSLGLLGAKLAQPMIPGRGVDWGAIGRGWRLIRGRSEMFWMMIFYGFSNFAWLGPLQVGVPRLVRLIFHSGPTMLGVVNGAFGLGLLLGTLLAGRLGRDVRAIRYMFLFTAASDLVLGAAGFQTNSWGLAVAFFASGLLFAPVGPLFSTYVQSRTPPDTMTSVLSFTSLTLQGVQPVSVLASGLFSAFDPRVLFLAAGSIATVADLVGFSWVNKLMGRDTVGGTK